MRWAACLLSATAAFAQTGIVDGTVIDTVASAPIPGATVKLHRGDESPQSTTSDTQGRFRFDAIPGGEYRITISHSAHMPLDRRHSTASPFLLSAANPEVHIRAELVPLARISGRVLSTTNQPIAGIPVGLRRIWDEHWIMTTWTAKDGSFQFNTLEPATWILAALPLMRIQTRTPEKDPKPIAPPAAEEGQRVGWSTTFFPSITDFEGAERIVLRPGTQLTGYDIKLRTVPVHRVSGIVLDEDGKPVPKAHLSLGDRSGKGIHGEMKSAGGDGRFVFDAIPDGEWRLFAQAKRLDQTHKGYSNLHVSRRDTDNLEVRITPPFPVSGFIDREEPRDREGKRKVTGVYLLPQDAPYDFQESAFHEQEGEVVLKNVYAARYRILAVGYVPGYYVHSVWYGDQQATTQPIDIVNPPLPIKVIYKSGAARLSGAVERGDGSAVALIPQDEALRDPHQFIRTAICNAQGKFSIDSLRPGSYYALAFNRVQADMLADLDFARRLTPNAVRVELRHGESATIDLRPQTWPDY